VERIRKGDRVVLRKRITSSRNPDATPIVAKGAQSVVLEIDRAKGRARVERVNLRWHHQRPNRLYPQGTRLEREEWVQLSNLMPYCDQCKRGVRVTYRTDASGTKEKCCRKCGTVLRSGGK